MKLFRLILAGTFAATSVAAQAADDRFTADDLTRLATVAEPALSPDGRLIAYSVEIADIEADKQQSDLWRIAWYDRFLKAGQ